MYCPFCGHTETKVNDSRLAGEGRQIRRRRECLACAERFTTFEAAELLKDRELSQAVRLDAVRLLQIALGGLTAKSAKGSVFEGYSRKQPAPAIPDEVRSVLRDAFPAGQAELDAELARTLAMIEDDSPQLGLVRSSASSSRSTKA